MAVLGGMQVLKIGHTYPFSQDDQPIESQHTQHIVDLLKKYANIILFCYITYSFNTSSCNLKDLCVFNVVHRSFIKRPSPCCTFIFFLVLLHVPHDSV